MFFVSRCVRVLLCVVLVGLFGCWPDPDPQQPGGTASSGWPCQKTADCCSYSPSALCSSTGYCESNFYCAQDPNCYIYRGGLCGNPNGNPGSTQDVVVTKDVSVETCPTFPVGIQVQSGFNQCGGSRGVYTQEDMALLNEFWGSGMYACPCSYQTQMCQGNAYYTSQSIGYLYYDPALFEQKLQRYGSRLPAAMVLSHEAGHGIQLHLGVVTSYTIQRELGADCLAGFYLGWLMCKGMTNQVDISSTFSLACSLEDPEGTPWFSSGAHGTCEQRMSALSKGIDAYKAGLDPFPACAF